VVGRIATELGGGKFADGGTAFIGCNILVLNPAVNALNNPYFKSPLLPTILDKKPAA
jgi:hypothetical protein